MHSNSFKIRVTVTVCCLSKSQLFIENKHAGEPTCRWQKSPSKSSIPIVQTQRKTKIRMRSSGQLMLKGAAVRENFGEKRIKRIC